MAARRGPVGDELAAAAFPDTDVAGLAAAVHASGGTSGGGTSGGGTSVRAALVDALDPQHWQQSRSAIAGLRRTGAGALGAVPALAGWARLCAPRAVSGDEQFAVNECMLALAELRRLAGEPADAVADFLDTVFAPALMTLLVPPLRVWHRGALTYLRGPYGDPERLASVLHGFLTALDDGARPEGDPDGPWHEYTRMELVMALAELGPRLEQLRVERSWQATTPAPAAASRTAADATPGPAANMAVGVAGQREVEVPVSLTAWLIGELAVPSMARRRAACAALATLGPQAAEALPALLRLLAELDQAPDAVVGDLRNQALDAAVALSSPQQ